MGKAGCFPCTETDWNEQLHRNTGRIDVVPEQTIIHMQEERMLLEGKEAHHIQRHCT